MKLKTRILSLLSVMMIFCAADAFADFTGIDESCISSGEYERVLYFLVDRSDECEDTDGFEKTFRALSEMVQGGERLLIGVSTGKASDTRLLMDMARPKKSIWVSNLKLRASEKKFTDCIEQVKKSLLSYKESYKHSALMETLGFVSKALAQSHGKPKRVVLYSDMMQNSESLSFYSSGTLEAAPLLKKVKSEELLWEFPEVDVYVAGTGMTISDKKARKLEKFWKSYFEEAGGELVFYGPILLLD